jgi:lipoprotein-anchoring transpeptidase ErfK/SrfK
MDRFAGTNMGRQRRGRRAAAAVLVLGLLTAGCTALPGKVAESALSHGESAPKEQQATSGAQPLLLPADVTGGAQVAVESEQGKLQLLTKSGSKWSAVSGPLDLKDAQIRIQQTSSGPLVVWMGHLPEHAAFAVTLKGAAVVPAAGGEPTFRAWVVTGGKLQATDYYQAVAPKPPAATAIVVDKGINALWFYQDGKLVLTKRVATGRYLQAPFPTLQNQANNSITPLGTFTVGKKVVNPIYYHDNIPGGDPKNPLGTRFMGLNVFQGDGAGIWAIHGTNEPDLIGQWVSDGCVRMHTEDAVQLFDMVEIGTKVQIIDSYHTNS